MDSSNSIVSHRTGHPGFARKQLPHQAKIRAHSKRMPVNQDESSEEDDDDAEDDEDDDEEDEDSNIQIPTKTEPVKRSGGIGSKRLPSDDEDDDDEEEEEGDHMDQLKASAKKRPRVGGKRGMGPASTFFDDEAGVSSAEEDEDEDENEDDFLPRDSAKDVEELEKSAVAANRGYDAKQRINDLLASVDEEAVKRHYERYNHDDSDLGRFGEGEMMANDIVQQQLLPGVSHPNLWLVRCKIGEEKQTVIQIMRKYISSQFTLAPMLIKCALVKEGLKGHIYIEAYKQTHVKQAIEGIRALSLGLYNQPMVPIKEMPDVLRVMKNRLKLSIGQWVRIKRGVFRDDLAQIDTVLDVENALILKHIPRIDYKRMRGALRSSNPPANPKDNKRFKRPPLALFEPHKVRAIGGEFKTAVISGNLEFEGAEYDNDGFSYRKFSFNQVQIDGIKPSLAELERFKETPESVVNSSVMKKSLNEQEHNFVPGDVVQVVKGELSHLEGVVISIDGNQITLQPSHSELKDLMPFLASDLRKHFKNGDHVKIVSGAHENETGLVIKITKHEAIVWSDVTQSEIKVAPKLLQLCQERSTGVDSSGHYMIGDLVELAAKQLGVVVRTSKDHLEILGTNGRIVTRKQNEVFRRKVNRFAHSLDVHENQLQVKDVLVVNEGPHSGSQGEIKHIHNQFLFCYSRMHLENGGLFVVRSRQVSLRNSVSGSSPAFTGAQHMVYGGGGGGGGGPVSAELFVPQSPRLGGGGGGTAAGQSSTNGGGGEFKAPFGVGADRPANQQRPHQSRGGGSTGGGGLHHFSAAAAARSERFLVGKTVRIIKGTMKGKIGIVKSCHDDQFSLELHSEYKTILVKRENVAEVDHQGRIIAPHGSSTGAGAGGHTAGSQGDRYGGQHTPGGGMAGGAGGRTPSAFMFGHNDSGGGGGGGGGFSMSGSRTPSAAYGAGSMTPMYGGGSTPYHDGGQTPRYGSERGGLTPNTHFEAFDPAGATPHSGFGASSAGSGLVSPASSRDEYGGGSGGGTGRSLGGLSFGHGGQSSEDPFMRSPTVRSGTRNSAGQYNDYLGGSGGAGSSLGGGESRSPLIGGSVSSLFGSPAASDSVSFGLGLGGDEDRLAGGNSSGLAGSGGTGLTAGSAECMPTEYIATNTVVLIPQNVANEQPAQGSASQERLVRAVVRENLGLGATRVQVMVLSTSKIISVLIDDIYKARPETGDKVRILNDPDVQNLGQCLSVENDEGIITVVGSVDNIQLIKLYDMVPFYTE